MAKNSLAMLVILDGWGWREDPADNAVLQADTPAFDRLWSTCPHAFLRTSGKDVGLPPGQMGNSEVGHLNIGAGRLVMQDLPRINDAIESGSIAKMPALSVDRAPAADRRHVSSDGPRVSRRRAFAPGARGGAGQDFARRRVPTVVHAVHRRSRHAAAIGGRRPRPPDRRAAAGRDDRHRVRALLCDGPRQPVGARQQGLHGDLRGLGAPSRTPSR